MLTIFAANAKSRRERRIAIVSPRVIAWLQSRRAIGGAGGHPYGDERGGEPVSFRKAWLSILELVKAENPETDFGQDLRWHDLRHECGSRLADRNLGRPAYSGTTRALLHPHNAAVSNTDAMVVGAAMEKAMNW